MKGATSIQERLWELRKDKGLNLEELSKLTGISKSALGSYEKEDFKEINHGNLITLADFYGVSVDYLLCRTENKEQINTPLTELHLNDEMVALLKSGRINNRLLCELATHKDFIKFLADIEIYVDGIATMQIQNLNALVDTVRHEIIERYRPGEDDPHLKVLQAAHISDDEYFSHMVLDDLNLIIRDIRESHKKDSESAPQTTVADELKENLEAVEKFQGQPFGKTGNALLQATRYQLQKFIGRRISLADSDSPKIKENGNAYQPEEKMVKKNRCCMVCWLHSM